MWRSSRCSEIRKPEFTAVRAVLHVLIHSPTAKVEKKKVWIAFFVKNAPRSTRPHRTRIFSLASSPGFRYLLASVNDTVDGPYVGDRSAESLPD